MGQVCHSEHVEVKKQFVEVYSLPAFGFEGSNSDDQALPM